jgi:DNA-binding transcriptional LysR family regulator
MSATKSTLVSRSADTAPMGRGQCPHHVPVGAHLHGARQGAQQPGLPVHLKHLGTLPPQRHQGSGNTVEQGDEHRKAHGRGPRPGAQCIHHGVSRDEQAGEQRVSNGPAARLGTTAGVSPLLLPRALEALARERPGVNVKLEVLGSEASMARLRAGTIDIAIVALPQKATPGVKLVPWRRDQMVAILPADWRVPARITPQWLAEHGWMGFDASTQMHKLIAAWFGRAGLNPRPSMEVNYPLALKSLAAAGQGVAVLPLEDPLEARSGAGLQVRPLSPLLMRELALAHRTAEPHEATVDGVLQSFKGFSAITRFAR